jgi:hypothetical protein
MKGFDMNLMTPEEIALERHRVNSRLRNSHPDRKIKGIDLREFYILACGRDGLFSIRQSFTTPEDALKRFDYIAENERFRHAKLVKTGEGGRLHCEWSAEDCPCDECEAQEQKKSRAQN